MFWGGRSGKVVIVCPELWASSRTQETSIGPSCRSMIRILGQVQVQRLRSRIVLKSLGSLVPGLKALGLGNFLL